MKPSFSQYLVGTGGEKTIVIETNEKEGESPKVYKRESPKRLYSESKRMAEIKRPVPKSLFYQSPEWSKSTGKLQEQDKDIEL